MRISRPWLIGLVLLVLTAGGRAQVELVFRQGGETHVVTGFSRDRAVYQKDDKTLPVSGDGKWEIRPAANFAKPQGLVEVSYGFQIVHRQAQPPGADEVEVSYQVAFQPVETAKNLYCVVAWSTDNQLTHVFVRGFGDADPKGTWHIDGRLSIKVAEQHGYLRAYLFQEGKSLGGLAPAETGLLKVRTALDAGDFVAVSTWLNGPGRSQSLPPSFFGPIARTGEAALLDLALSGPGAKHITGEGGRNILLAAAETGREACVNLLLQKGVSANADDEGGYSALSRAIRADSEPVVQALLAAKADPEHITGRDFNPIRNSAFKSGDAGLTKLLLAHGLRMPGPRELDDYFLDAVEQQQVDMAALILQRAKDPRALLDRPVLLLAALNSNHAMLKMLLAAGAEIKVADPKGVTAIMGAAFAGDAEAVGWLELAGASLTASDAENRTAADWAWKGGHDEIVIKLLKDAPLTEPAASRMLRNALITGKSGVAMVLLEQGANLDPTAADADHVLTAVIRAGNVAALSRALDRGLKVDRQVYRDWNLAGLAQRYHQTEITAELEKRAGHPLEPHQPVAADLPLEVFTRGPRPDSAGGESLTGEARVEVYVDADGIPCAPRLLSSTNEKVGCAALASIDQWRFDRLSELARPWRKIVVPMEFSTADATGERLWEVNEWPRIQERVKVTDEATQVRDAALVHFTISASGAVVLPRVICMSSPGLEETALKLLRGLKYYPARKNQNNVAYPAEGVLLMPVGVLIEPNRLTYLGQEDIQPQIKVGKMIKLYPKSLEVAQRRVMILAALVIDRKGDIKDFKFRNSPPAEYAQQAEKLFHALQYKPIVLNGVAIEYPATMALIFGRPGDE